MAARLMSSVTVSELAVALGLRWKGPDIEIGAVSALSDLETGGLAFAKATQASAAAGAVLLAPMDQEALSDVSVILAPSPRLYFAKALQWLAKGVGFARPTEGPRIHPTARIGQYCVFGQGVQIGEDCVIGNHVTLGDNTVIGARSVIKSCAVIGEDGFGFERDEDGLPLRLIHLGGVRIGEDAEVGCFTTVCRGTLSDTIIEDHAKVDDHVHVAHNVRIRRGAMVIACAELSGGVEVGERAWVGPNATVIQQVKIGADAMVGIGANVLKHVSERAVVAGNPAKPILPKGTA